jgi:MFS family permease
VAGYDALQAGLATLPTTLVMFALSKRAGRLADRFGPRWFMGFGPLLAAAGLLGLSRVGATVDYWTDVLPPLLLFSLGLAATVAPLTATVLADADDSNAGIASGVNNAIARVAGLLAIAALGAVVAASFSSSIDRHLAGRPLSPAARQAVAQAKKRALVKADVSRVPPPERPVVANAVENASVHAFHLGLMLSAALVALGGLLGLVGIVNPRRAVRCADCAGGQLAGQPSAAVSEPVAALSASGAGSRPLRSVP